MINEFQTVIDGITSQLNRWQNIFINLNDETITNKRNNQNRNIKQIVGHMVDSASNNTHRVIHLQYNKTPLVYPNYATNGNNDRWIAIQNYEDENWSELIQLWKSTHLHYCHVVSNINESKLENKWIASPVVQIDLKEMVIDFLRHFNLHLSEIESLVTND